MKTQDLLQQWEQPAESLQTADAEVVLRVSSSIRAGQVKSDSNFVDLDDYFRLYGGKA